MWSSSNRLPLAVVAVAALLLGGCGFHLRGAMELPPQLARVQLIGVAPRSVLADEITYVLEGADARVVSVDATSLLRVTSERSDRRLLSVDSSGRAREYELVYELGFELTAPAPIDAAARPQPAQPRVLVPAQVVSVVRDFPFDPNNVLGTGEEETVIRNEMRSAAVRQMMVRLSAALRGKQRP